MKISNYFALVLFALSLGLSKNAAATVVSAGPDCGGAIQVIRAEKVTAGGESRLQVQLAVFNHGFEKEIYVVNPKNGQNSKAVWSNSWWQYAVAATYQGRNNNDDIITIYDQMVGPESVNVRDYYVKMGGRQYSCTGVVIGP